MARKRNVKRAVFAFGALSVGSFLMCLYACREMKEEMTHLRQELELTKILHPSSSNLDRDESVRTMDLSPHMRRLNGRYIYIAPYASAQANSGCVIVDLSSADVTLALDTKACNGHRCPPCFMTTGSNGAGHKLVLSGCSSMFLSDDVKSGSGSAAHPFYNSLHELTIVNTDNSTAATVSDGQTSSLVIPANRAAKAFCYSGGGDALYFAVVEASPAQNAVTTVTTTTGPLYQLGVQGENGCPSGYTFIASKADCQSAAGEYGLSQNLAGSPYNWPDAIKGCFKRCTNDDCGQGEYFRFNGHATGGTRDDLQQWAVCKRV